MDTNFYDNIIHVALINLYTISKEKRKITLKNFDYTLNSHKAFLEIAKIAQSIFNLKISIQYPLFKYILFKLKTKDNTCYRYKRKEDSVEVNVEDFICHIETANESFGVFRKIYESYYKRGKK